MGRLSPHSKCGSEYGIAILGSFREKGAPGPKNTCVLIGADGEVYARYSKSHLFSPAGEQNTFVPGEGIALFTLGGMRCGIAICYDLRLPPLFRAYARAGAEAVFVPAAWPARRIEQWELSVRARALENQIFVIGINTTGTTPVDVYNGHSLISGPEGEVIARTGEEEELLYAGIDRMVLEEADETSFQDDRRPVLPPAAQKD
jgi:predicted amidohydrolase